MLRTFILMRTIHAHCEPDWAWLAGEGERLVAVSEQPPAACEARRADPVDAMPAARADVGGGCEAVRA